MSSSSDEGSDAECEYEVVVRRCPQPVPFRQNARFVVTPKIEPNILQAKAPTGAREAEADDIDARVNSPLAHMLIPSPRPSPSSSGRQYPNARHPLDSVVAKLTKQYELMRILTDRAALMCAGSARPEEVSTHLNEMVAMCMQELKSGHGQHRGSHRMDSLTTWIGMLEEQSVLSTSTSERRGQTATRPAASIHIVTVRRAFEESQLFAAPPHPTAWPSCASELCQGELLPKLIDRACNKTGPRLRAFFYPHELDNSGTPFAKLIGKPRTCLLCIRFTVSMALYHISSNGTVMPADTCIQPHKNHVGVGGEYPASDCLVPEPQHRGLVGPIVRHVANKYKPYTDPRTGLAGYLQLHGDPSHDDDPLYFRAGAPLRNGEGGGAVPHVTTTKAPQFP